jgi:hypothetical protein
MEKLGTEEVCSLSEHVFVDNDTDTGYFIHAAS